MTDPAARGSLRGMRSPSIAPLLAVLVLAAPACKRDYDEPELRRVLERSYREAHPGWTVHRRQEGRTWFVRGDQLDELDVPALFAEYQASGQSGTDWVAAWLEAAKAEDASRHRTLEEAQDEVIPLLKSAKWIEIQDLGAIGPKHKLLEIKPWRAKITEGLFIVLGVPEVKLGYRFASIAEVEAMGLDEQAWIDKSTQNLVRLRDEDVKDPDGKYQGVPVEISGKIEAFDLENARGVSGLVLDKGFRRAMLRKFARADVGAAVPIRDVLIVFNPDNFVAKKPARNRAHKLYDTQNHPAFRGLLRLDENGVYVLEE